MTLHLGDVPASSTLYIPFASYNSSGASVTLTGLAATDIEIYKNGSTTQRSSDAGYTLLDTDGIDFDGITGLHGFSVDLSDNTDAGFYAVGSFYWVVVSTVTIDSQTVTLIAATFRIVAAEAITGKPKVDVDGWLGTACATPTTNGVPEVDLTHIAGSAVSTTTAQLGVNVVNAGGTAWGSGAITAAAIANGAIDAATFAADVDAEILSYIVDDATRIDASALNTASVTSIPAILEDTGTTLQGELDGIQADTEDIQSRLPAALTAGGNMKSDALAVNGSTTGAANLAKSAAAMLGGTCDAGSTTTSIVVSAFDAAMTDNDQLVGRTIIFLSNTSTGGLKYQASDITDFVQATNTLTVTALTRAPASGDVFIIV